MEVHELGSTRGPSSCLSTSSHASALAPPRAMTTSPHIPAMLRPGSWLIGTAAYATAAAVEGHGGAANAAQQRALSASNFSAAPCVEAAVLYLQRPCASASALEGVLQRSVARDTEARHGACGGPRRAPRFVVGGHRRRVGSPPSRRPPHNPDSEPPRNLRRRLHRRGARRGAVPLRRPRSQRARARHVQRHVLRGGAALVPGAHAGDRPPHREGPRAGARYSAAVRATAPPLRCPLRSARPHRPDPRSTPAAEPGRTLPPVRSRAAAAVVAAPAPPAPATA